MVLGRRVRERDWVIHFMKTAKSTRGFIIATRSKPSFWLAYFVHIHLYFIVNIWSMMLQRRVPYVRMVTRYCWSDKYLLFNYCRWTACITLKRRQDKGSFDARLGKHIQSMSRDAIKSWSGSHTHTIEILWINLNWMSMLAAFLEDCVAIKTFY